MNNSEIEIIKDYLENLMSEFINADIICPEAKMLAKVLIKALEKQVPVYGHNDGEDYWCPKCKIFTGTWDDAKYVKYCPYCGQALKWEE